MRSSIAAAAEPVVCAHLSLFSLLLCLDDIAYLCCTVLTLPFLVSMASFSPPVLILPTIICNISIPEHSGMCMVS